MVQARRFKYFIIATVVCAVLLCVALFSVSFAAWSGGGSASAEVSGEASKFYVEYPQYVTSDNSNTVIPQLQKNKYYLQVPKRDDGTMSDYYEFEDNPSNSSEVMLMSVYLYPGDVLDMYHAYETGPDNNKVLHRDRIGTGNKGGKILARGASKDDPNANSAITTDIITHDDTAKKFTIQSKGEGLYDLYFDHTSGSMFVWFIGKPDEDNGNSGGNETSFDVTGYTNPITLQFTDGTFTLYFKAGVSSGAYSNVSNLYMHIWKGSTTYLNNTQISTVVGTKVINVSKNEVNFMLNFGGTWDTQSSNPLSFEKYAKNDINCITAHTAANTSPKWIKGGSGTVGSGGGNNEANNRTEAEPDYEGSTTFGATATQSLNKEKEVRKVNAATQAVSGKYTYKNYISVSRKNSDVTTDDNSIAFLEFEVKMPQGSTLSPYNIVVDSVSITRRETDAKGNIGSDYVATPPRIYNYDPNVETRLGPDPSHTVPDYDGKKGYLPIFAHGKQHIVKGEGATASDVVSEHMKNHYDDGAYVVLYFGDNDQQYFALDIEIQYSLAAGVSHTGDVSFELTVKASNKNNWERYEDGYGEPWGFYMGGLINGVKTWDPNRTAKLERASTNNVTSFSESKETAALGKSIEDTSLASEKIDAFNTNKNFNYKIINYGVENNKRSYARYPKGKLDMSLTINLTENSRIKIYMVDNVGHRINGISVYVVPNEIVYDDATREMFIGNDKYPTYDNDLNIVIPQTGTYVLRLVGYFHTGDETVNGKSGRWFNFKTGARSDSGNTSTGKQLPNYNLIVDYLYLTCANEGNSTIEVTLNGSGGTFSNGSEQMKHTVTFGSDISKLPKPTLTGKKFAGWYYKENGEDIDIDTGAITEAMELYARWDETHKITFNANGGKFAGDKETLEITTQNDGVIANGDLPADPVRSKYTFLGWFTEATDGEEVDVTSKEFDDDDILYAHWKKNSYAVTFDLKDMPSTVNGQPVTAPDQQLLDEGEKAKDPVSNGWVLPEHYHIDNWKTSTGSVYSFSSNVTSDITLYADWYADNGLYANDTYVVAITTNPKDGVSATRLKAEDATLTQGDTVKFWYDKKQVTDNMSIRSGCPAKDNITANSDNTLTVGKTESYSFYYEKAGGSETGIWVTYGGPLKSGDGVYVGTTLVKAFTQSASDINSKQATAAELIVTETTTFTVKYSGFDRIPTVESGCTVGTTVNNQGIKLNKGVYNFYYKYQNNEAWISAVNDKYIVEFKTNDGTNTTFATLLTENTKKLTSLPTEQPTRENYVFAGWYTSSDTNASTQVTTNYTFSGHSTVYAKWECVVTFDANDGCFDNNTAVTSKNVTTANRKITNTPTPSRTGYEFLGWATTKTGSVIDNISSRTYSKETLYAQWARVYTVTLNANGGTLNGASTVTTNTDHTLDLSNISDPTRPANDSGKSFAGWYLQNGTEVTSATTFENDTTTIYAQWYITVSFNTNGGTPATVDAKTQVLTGSAIGELPTVSNASHTFDGWKINSSSSAWSSTTTVTQTNSFELTAYWTAIEYTLDYKNVPDSYQPTYTTYKVTDGTITLNEPDAPSGQKFDKWTLGENGDTITDGKITPSLVEDLDADHATLNICAHFVDDTPATVTVTFNFNYSGAGTTTMDADSNGYLTSLPTNPTREWYEFVGWFDTDATSGGNQIDTTHQFSDGETVYARWKELTVTFNFSVEDTFIAAIKDVTIAAWGNSSYTGTNQRQSMTSVTKNGKTGYNFTYTVTLSASKGNVKGINIEFKQGTNSWKAYSGDYTGTFVGGNTYNLKFVSWDDDKYGTINFNTWVDVPFVLEQETSSNSNAPASNQYLVRLKDNNRQYSNVRIWLWKVGTDGVHYDGGGWTEQPSMTYRGDCWCYKTTRKSTGDTLNVIFTKNNLSSETATKAINEEWGSYVDRTW